MPSVAAKIPGSSIFISLTFRRAPLLDSSLFAPRGHDVPDCRLELGYCFLQDFDD
jgi:hypothetical protein